MDRLTLLTRAAWSATAVLALGALATAASFRWYLAIPDGGGRVRAFSRARWVDAVWPPTLEPLRLGAGQWVIGRDPGSFPWWGTAGVPPLRVTIVATPLVPVPLAAATALWAGVVLERRRLRRVHGCKSCEYDLRGLPRGSPCPECGAAGPLQTGATRFHAARRAHDAQHAMSRSRSIGLVW